MKVLLAWDKPLFHVRDEEVLRQMLELGVIDGVKTGHITDSVEDDSGVTTTSIIRSFIKDNVSPDTPDKGPIYFKDAKMYDVANTVIEAVKHLVSRSHLGNRIDLITFHPGISIRALREIAKICDDAGTAAILTTALTDMSTYEFTLRFGRTPKRQAYEVAHLALECGLRGVVCSGNELPYLRYKKLLDDLVTVTPALRPVWAPQRRGQRRTMTPERAAELGSTFGVIGSSILGHEEPLAAATRIHQDIAAVSTQH